MSDRPSEQRTEGSGLMSPREWVRFISQVGAPWVLLAYIIYIGSTQLAPFIQRLAENADLMRTHISVTNETKEKLDQQQRALDILIQIAKFNCLHQSKDVEQRRECYDATLR